jgi:alpha-1,3-glucan synthase
MAIRYVPFNRSSPQMLTPLQPLDLTLLDRHFGQILEWRTAIDEIHRRGMYVILDNTMST